MLERSIRPLVGLAALTLVLGACASTGLQPQTGDVSFRLRWTGEADLDLHVVDPNDRHTGVPLGLNDPSPGALIRAAEEMAARDREDPDAPKGILDVDCNASPDAMCPRPIENVFWPVGTAPEGRYEVWIHLFQKLGDDTEVPFTLEVRRGERVVETFSGQVDDSSRHSPRYVYRYSGRGQRGVSQPTM